MFDYDYDWCKICFFDEQALGKYSCGLNEP